MTLNDWIFKNRRVFETGKMQAAEEELIPALKEMRITSSPFYVSTQAEEAEAPRREGMEETQIQSKAERLNKIMSEVMCAMDGVVRTTRDSLRQISTCEEHISRLEMLHKEIREINSTVQRGRHGPPPSRETHEYAAM